MVESRPVAAEIHLAPGHGLAGKDLLYAGLRVSSAPDCLWRTHGIREAPDGGLDLCLLTGSVDEEGRRLAWYSRHEDDDVWGEGRTAPFPPAPFDGLLVVVALGSECLAFARASDGAFERVRDRAHELEVDCRALPAEDWMWRLRWSWRGMRHTFGWVRGDAVGEGRVLRFSAPESGAVLEWLASEAGDSSNTTKRFGAGSLPLDQTRVRLEFP